MKRILLFLALFFISTLNIYSQVYYPLAIGNRWDFQRTEWDPLSSYSKVDTFSVIVIKDTLIQNCKKYFTLNTDYLGVSKYIHTDAMGIYYYIPEKSKEWLVYRNNINFGESYKVDSAEVGCPLVTLELKDTLIYFGYVINSLLYTYNWMIGHYIVLSDKFGPVSHHTGGDGTSISINSKLLGCRISSVCYGNLTTVEKTIDKASGFYLSRNYPNPFNPTTTISYSIPNESHVVLKVYDLLGREMSTLVNKEQSTGEYKVNFDGTSLSSGIYIYTIQAGDYRASKKLMFLK